MQEIEWYFSKFVSHWSATLLKCHSSTGISFTQFSNANGIAGIP